MHHARRHHARRHARHLRWHTLRPRHLGGLDCNGLSHRQRTARRSAECTDIRGFRGRNRHMWEHRFFDNGTYIGHDEPDMTFLSSRAGSGNDVTWTETLGTDPSAAPTVASPGSDVTHWFELSVAPWFSMAMCDPNSYPQANCTPQSDANAPTCTGSQTSGCSNGGGSAFMEMQFYPPGMPPFADAVSCNDHYWCAALTIDSLACTAGFATCNTQCEEPVNFAYIQTNGVPTGPASPQEQDLQSYTPNANTLMMSPGDRVTVHMFDAPARGGGKAFKVVVDDLTTGQTGSMQASAANGFATTSMANCSGTPFNFQPEYNTAKKQNIVPWAALQTNISTQFEIGHFTPCTNVTDKSKYAFGGGVFDAFWNSCKGPYENNSAKELGEPSDAFCYPQGDTHGSLGTEPDLISGCLGDYAQNGDLDFDGTPYWADWPTGSAPSATFPGSFVQNLPTTGRGSSYSQYFVQTDVALSESSCSNAGSGCTVPPNGPGGFYPYWSRVGSNGNGCTLEFGNVSSGAGVNTLGGDAQYGSDQAPSLGYDEFEGPVLNNASCAAPTTG